MACFYPVPARLLMWPLRWRNARLRIKTSLHRSHVELTEKRQPRHTAAARQKTRSVSIAANPIRNGVPSLRENLPMRCVDG